jgi:hypothetical protein
MSTVSYVVRDAAGNIVDQRVVEVGSTASVNEMDLREKARTALALNDAFLALASPTNAQTLTQVQRLTRECSALIRLAIRALDTTDGT